MSTRNWVGMAAAWAAVLAVVVIAYGAGTAKPEPATRTAPDATNPTAEKVLWWTCPMHPEVQSPDPGQCPKCGMDLVPQKEGGKDPGPRRLVMSDAAKKLAEIETSLVVRKFVTREVRMVGMLRYDETRIRTISAWVPGRLDRLYVDFTGTRVREGDHLVLLYSPEMLQAQQELLEAKRSLEETKRERSEFLQGSDRRRYESAREKLVLWGLSATQVDAIEKRGSAEDHVTIRSPATGIVIHKALNQGNYVQTGTPIYRIADLEHLWIELDAYESDLPWIRYGQEVLVTTEAYPGEIFRGWLSFLAPDLDTKTRTVKVRVNVDNEAEKLKPGMFVRAVVHANVAKGGKVMNPELRGKWICPMHPEIVAGGAGSCDVCGMDLVPAEQLGYVPVDANLEKPLVIPASAALVTGRRGVVYVAVPGAEQPTYEGREVVLGPRTEEHYIVLAGLREGERVVTRGSFKIDSALQIKAKRSMMSMPAESGLRGATPTPLLNALAAVYQHYFAASAALASDDGEKARTALGEFLSALAAVEPAELSPQAATLFRAERGHAERAAREAADAPSIEAMRERFADLSAAVIALDETFGHPGSDVHYEMYCPMARNDTGARWLQQRPELRNPYMGARMLACGETRLLHPGTGKGRAIPVVAPLPAKQPEPKAPAHEDHQKHQGHGSGEASAALAPLYGTYFALQEALAADDAEKARSALEELKTAAAAAKARALPDAAKALVARILEAASQPHAGIAGVRSAFRNISAPMIELEKATGHGGTAVHYEVHCSMAFGNEGASWLQRAETISNPYYGSQMLRCGEIVQRYPAAGGRR